MTDTINQTPAEKAKWLYDTFHNQILNDTGRWEDDATVYCAKQCAFLVVEQIRPCTWKEETYYKKWGFTWVAPETTTEYWEAVREAIKVL